MLEGKLETNSELSTVSHEFKVGREVMAEMTVRGLKPEALY